MIPIIETGSYLYPDANGFIQKTVHPSLIQARWQPVLDAVVDFYRTQLQDDLLSIYIRGSVAKGTAVNGISDVDSFFISKTMMKFDETAKNEFRRRMKAEFPFVNGIEITGRPVSRLGALSNPKPRSVWLELIKTQSICIWGKDFTDEIEPFLLTDLFAHVYGIEEEMRRELAELPSDPPLNSEGIKNRCAWIMKRLLRTGFEIVMLREQAWTRDLHPCYRSFSKHYPDKEPLMRAVLHLVLNPTDDRHTIISVISTFQPWLYQEIRANTARGA